MRLASVALIFSLLALSAVNAAPFDESDVDAFDSEELGADAETKADDGMRHISLYTSSY